jgi:hypothetical protein
MDCQICFESFTEFHKVTCESPVDHVICFDCETKWRAKMPIRDGARVMTCPTCRNPETTRTMDSLQRELSMFYVSAPQEVTLRDAVRVIAGLNSESRNYFALRLMSPGGPYRGRVPAPPAPPAPQAAEEPAPVRPRQQFCESGRDCRTRSRIHNRTKTHMKCRTCQEVPCCANCRVCSACEPV